MIKIVCVGKIKKDYIISGIDDYSKMISGFTKLNIVEVKEVNSNDLAKNIQEEGKNILARISDNEYVITLEINGERLDSVALAKTISELFTYNTSCITFVIGGSNGLSKDVISRANKHLSFSSFTFPHQLMRLILTEQIYRAFTIINNKEYHK